MTRMDNEKFKNGNYKIENRLKASDKRWDKAINAQKTAHQEKAIKGKAGSFERMNKERKSQGAKPIKDRASKGLYAFLDKYDK